MISDLDQDNPWPGLRAFQDGEEQFFRGREVETERLYRLVERESVSVLYGASGLGKTSLLTVGLFPRLHRSRILPVYLRIDYRGEITPEEQIKRAIAMAASKASVETPPRREPETLWEYLHRVDAHFWSDRNEIVVPLLVFDQFEEIFTLGNDRSLQSETFLADLSDLAEGRPPSAVREQLDASPERAAAFAAHRHNYKVLLSLREDFLGRLDRLRAKMPSSVRNRMALERMNGRNALRVVELGEHLLDVGVSEHVVRFVAVAEFLGGVNELRPLEKLDVEPALLSLFCRELNRRRGSQPKITSQLLSGSREEILTAFYEDSLAGLDAAVRVFMEERLLTQEGFRDNVAWENAKAVIGEEALALLVDRRLLRSEEREGRRRVEFVHDVLTGVIGASRGLRRQREELLTAKGRERQAQRKLRRVQWALAGLAVLLLVVLCVLGWGWRNLRRAQRAEESARDAQKSALNAQQEAQAAEGQVKSALAEADFADAARLVQQGEVPTALAHLARSLRFGDISKNSTKLAVDLLLSETWPLPVLEIRLPRALLGAEFNADGERLVTNTRDGTWAIWDARTGTPVVSPHRGKEGFLAHFSPNGEFAVGSVSDNTVQIWNVRSGLPVSPPLVHGAAVMTAGFSSDSQRVVTASVDGKARVWDVRRGQPEVTLARPERLVTACFSPDDRRVAIVTGQGRLLLWNIRTGDTEVSRDASLLTEVRFSPNGRHLVAMGSGFVEVIDLTDGRLRVRPLASGGIVSARFSSDGERVVTASWKGTAQVWDVTTGRLVGKPLRHRGEVRFAVFSPDGRSVLTTSADKTARIWDVLTGEPKVQPLHHASPVNSAYYSGDGRRVVTASEDGTVRVWDLQRGHTLPLRLPSQEELLWAEVPEASHVVATISRAGNLRVWEMTTGIDFAPIYASHSKDPMAIFFNSIFPLGSIGISQDEAIAVITEKANTLQLWSAFSGQRVGPPFRPVERLLAAYYDPSKGFFALTATGKTARIWNAWTGRQVGMDMHHEGPISQGQFDHYGRVVLTIADGTARTWGISGKPLTVPLRHDLPSGLQGLLSPAGDILATYQGQNLYLWDARSGRPLHNPIVHESTVLSAEFSRSGKLLVTGTKGGEAQIWDVTTGQPVSRPMPHDDSVTSVHFSTWINPTSSAPKLVGTSWVNPEVLPPRLVVTSAGKNARVWDARTGLPLSQPLSHDDKVLSARLDWLDDNVITVTSNSAYVWGIPHYAANTEILAELAETVGGLRINSSGTTVSIDDPVGRLQRLRQRVPEENSEVLDWFLADPATRTISPNAEITMVKDQERLRSPVASKALAGRTPARTRERPGG